MGKSQQMGGVGPGPESRTYSGGRRESSRTGVPPKTMDRDDGQNGERNRVTTTNGLHRAQNPT